MKNQIVN